MVQKYTDERSALDYEESMVKDAACGGCDGDGFRMVIDPDERMVVKENCGRCNGTGREPSKPTA